MDPAFACGGSIAATPARVPFHFTALRGFNGASCKHRELEAALFQPIHLHNGRAGAARVIAPGWCRDANGRGRDLYRGQSPDDPRGAGRLLVPARARRAPGNARELLDILKALMPSP